MVAAIAKAFPPERGDEERAIEFEARRKRRLAFQRDKLNSDMDRLPGDAA